MTNELRAQALWTLAAIGLVAAPKLCGAEADTVLWPSETTVLAAQPDSSATLLPDGSMGVETGVEYRWPGVRMDFTAGEKDLSGYGRVVVSVSNTTDRAAIVHLSVKGDTVQGQTPGGKVSLDPHAAGEITVDLCNMPWALDEPLELGGMNGYPKALGGGTTFDLRHTRSFHIFVWQKGVKGGFAVRRVMALQSGVKQKTLSAKTFLPFVDRFGQFAHDDWPGKIHDEAELAASRAAEEDWLGRNAEDAIPEADVYGGWAGGPQLVATGFFRTEKVNGKWWLVDPEGRLFFSHGVDAVGVGATTGAEFRESYFSWLPKKDDPEFGGFWARVSTPAARGFYKDPAHLPFGTFDFARANALRKYGPDWRNFCAARAHVRMRAWGLNTIACWSDPVTIEMRKTPYTAKFNTKGPTIEGSTGWWGKFRDPFAPEFAENAKKSAEAEAKRSGEDPWCIGWFVDNELSWGSDDREIARAVLRSPATQPAKLAARRLLERKYETVEGLDAAWGTKFGTWDAFLASTNVPNEKLCGPDLEEIHRIMVRRYYRTVRDALRSAAPHRLYLGSRIAWGSRTVYEECARHCDIVSVNLYSRLPDRDLPQEAMDKPMLVGEFHFGALDRGMFHTGLVAARDQKERAECYRAFVNACLDHPRYVGAHWFQWKDQPLAGRMDGENYQIGFVTVTDTPYPELVAASRDVAANMYRRRFSSVNPSRRSDK